MPLPASASDATNSLSVAGVPARPTVPRAALIAGLIVLAAVLNLTGLTSESLWCDEQYTVMTAIEQPTLAAVLESDARVETNPPLYMVVVHYWSLLAGDSDAALRLPSVLAGCLAVLFVFLLGEALGGLALGVASGLCLALLPWQVYYAQEARFYALLTMLVAALMWLATLVIYGRAARRHYVGLFVVALALALTHNYGGLMVGFAGLVFAADWMRRRQRGSLVALGMIAGGGALGLLLWAPYLPQQLAKAGNILVLITGTPKRLLLSLVQSLLPPDPDFRVAAGALLFVVAAFIATYSVATRSGRRFPRALKISPAPTVALLWLVGPLLLVFVLSQAQPCWAQRRLVSLTLAPTALLLGGLIVCPRHRLLRLANAAIIAALLVSGLFRVYAQHQKEEWREVGALVQSEERPGDRMLVMGIASIAPVFQRYYEGQAPVSEISRNVRERGELEQALRVAWPEGKGRLWVVLSHYLDNPLPDIVTGRREGARVELDQKFVGVRVMRVAGTPPG